jgi:DNA-binding transcriptional regulator YbjK
VAPEGAVAPEVAVAAKGVVAAKPAVAPKAAVTLKGAVTPKGERRRYALVSAAAELLCEGGFEAVRHRAVARRAGLPLASTTYYFSSLDDLIASAVAHIGMLEVAQLRAQVATLSRRRRGPETTADLLVDLLVGSESGPRLTEQLISRYERHIACARLPALRDIQRRNLRQRVDAVAEVIDRSGRSVRLELVSALICTVDGAVVSALVDDRQDPRTVARATVTDVIDAVAPFDRRPVQIWPRAGWISRWGKYLLAAILIVSGVMLSSATHLFNRRRGHRERPIDDVAPIGAASG